MSSPAESPGGGAPLPDGNGYQASLLRAQLRLRGLARRLYEQRRSLVVVFEGWDASGKGGAIRRLTARLDPRGYHVYSIAAPEGDDSRNHYLWRFWRRLRPPDEKQIIVFDRSWYGRVLVERVEGFATEPEWRRAFRETNSFERTLVEGGVRVVKFWMRISPEEQLDRFTARRTTPHKTWKLTDEDWRNREKWPQYRRAVDEMLMRTSTPHAPWTVVEAEDKRRARLKVLNTVVGVLERDLGPGSQPQ
ncbi:MAG: hypothetical protein JSU98_12325 [Gemmatimonadales bacterium]|nr:MAG: hypothetical protein JSU98_12325 [Gemmatimonadales bacterium]